MSDRYNDPIVAEVRKNREELLAEFDGDTKKLTAYLVAKRPQRIAAGFRYETAEERQARFAWSRQQQEILEQKLASV
ncbi:MAG: hypothetical protein LBC71_01095 [Oscillospiraceae bacterium]|jgi:hypothetical protein|nr:hypothetical protein [Oscillospiraceae bacterium]